MKRCSICGVTFDADGFYRRSQSPDGLTSACKGCVYASVRRSRVGKGRWIAPDDAAPLHEVLAARPDRVAAFWSALVVSEGGHWLWPGAMNKRYGLVTIGGKSRSVHRVAYTAAKGPIPDGLTIDHLCKVPLCCNPDHLEAVTGGVNTLRGDGPSGLNSRKTACKHGHEFTPDNTFIRVDGARSCRVCMREHDRKHKAKVRELRTQRRAA